MESEKGILIEMKTIRPAVTPDKRAVHYRTLIRPHGQKYANFHWPTKEVFISFIYTYHRIRAILEKLFKKYGLTRASWNALMILSRHGSKVCIQQDISELLFVSRANTTGLINGLVRKGLVVRASHPRDRRAQIIKISKKGEELLNEAIPQYHAKITEILSCLNASQKKELKGILERIQMGIERTGVKA